MRDPRTVARDIPGIFDAIFPQLVPGIVEYFNKQAISLPECKALPAELINESSLIRAMLFEIAYARGDQLISGVATADWDACLVVAANRQRRYFDAKLPKSLEPADIEIADWIAKNLVKMLNFTQAKAKISTLVQAPNIPGYQWVASGVGDFAVGSTLIEVKCTNKHFSAADYRQVVMYWLLSYASSIENDTPEWRKIVLVNPRLNHLLELSYDEIIRHIGAGRSKVEILELFSFVVGEYSLRMLG